MIFLVVTIGTMATNIKDLLGKSKYIEPPEIKRIKDYIKDKFQAEASIAVSTRQIIVAVPSAALAGTLRLHSHKMAEACQIDKRLVIRIN